MDNVHFNGLFYNTMPNASSSTIPQCVKSDPNLFKDDAEIRFSKTFNNCKVRDPAPSETKNETLFRNYLETIQRI
jgi:hypothetical protein